ncbi:MAG: DUF4911 domain-containing protein [Firmicutes bacterium HGW-Firmicutes-12]|jgi:uncharacterized protein (UPF0218 family)|nr:MAG: DUF4911 domain-containing protein [Firmicutes bacterium HGW-Firmicutes-12]
MINEIFLRIPRNKIAFLTKIIEGYDNLGVVTTIDPTQGVVVVRVTPDTEAEISEILSNLDFVVFL